MCFLCWFVSFVCLFVSSTWEPELKALLCNVVENTRLVARCALHLLRFDSRYIVNITIYCQHIYWGLFLTCISLSLSILASTLAMCFFSISLTAASPLEMLSNGSQPLPKQINFRRSLNTPYPRDAEFLWPNTDLNTSMQPVLPCCARWYCLLDRWRHSFQLTKICKHLTWIDRTLPFPGQSKYICGNTGSMVTLASVL